MKIIYLFWFNKSKYDDKYMFSDNPNSPDRSIKIPILEVFTGYFENYL